MASISLQEQYDKACTRLDEYEAWKYGVQDKQWEGPPYEALLQDKQWCYEQLQKQNASRSRGLFKSYVGHPGGRG